MAQAILWALAEEERLKRRLIMERCIMRQNSQPLMLPETMFMDQYRLRKSDFMVLCSDIAPFLPVSQRTSSIPLETKVLAALACYAHGSYQKSIGVDFNLGLSQSAVSNCLIQVTNALNEPSILGKYIKFPIAQSEREDVATRFMQNFGMPGVIGCIDGTHVAIIRPSEDEEVYFNRKNYHSLNVLIICDAHLKVLHVDASFGGQSHDSHVWNNSPVKELMQDIHEEGELCWLLGDSGYAQRPWLMTPILNALPNSPEEFYTKKHVQTRNVVERCIGVLKTRWRCLLAHRVLHYTPIQAAKITNACVVLHNLISEVCTIDREEMQRDRERQPTVQYVQNGVLSIDGGRRALVERLWRSRR